MCNCDVCKSDREWPTRAEYLGAGGVIEPAVARALLAIGDAQDRVSAVADEVEQSLAETRDIVLSRQRRAEAVAWIGLIAGAAGLLALGYVLDLMTGGVLR